jgi:hypothetical protein
LSVGVAYSLRSQALDASDGAAAQRGCVFEARRIPELLSLGATS